MLIAVLTSSFSRPSWFSLVRRLAAHRKQLAGKYQMDKRPRSVVSSATSSEEANKEREEGAEQEHYRAFRGRL